MKHPWLRLTAVAVLAATLALLFASCNKKPINPQRPATPQKTVTWRILDEDGAESQMDSEVMQAVLKQLAKIPDIEIVSKDAALQLGQMLSADTLPDLLTLPAHSTLCAKLIGSGKVVPVAQVAPKLADALPKGVRAFYENRDGALYGLPGGYWPDGTNQLPSAEGLYVRQEYYELLGSPAMNTTGQLVQALEEFAEVATRQGLLQMEEVLPIVFGANGDGFATVEHMFGVGPSHKANNALQHRIFAPGMVDVLDFFDQLERLAGEGIFELVSTNRLEQLLHQSVYAYVGPSDLIRKHNLNNPNATFVQVEPPFGKDGFLETRPQTGSWLTFVCNDSDKEAVATLLEVMSSEKSTTTLLYGMEDAHWVQNQTGKTPLPGVTKALQEDPKAFLEQTGIGGFAYLSNKGSESPYLSQFHQKGKDIASQRLWLRATDYYYYPVQTLDDQLIAFYQEVASPGVSPMDILDKISEYQPDELPDRLSP